MLTPTGQGPAPPAPRCPACGSRETCATDKTISASTYWRCANCGEIWNPGRLDSSPAAYRIHHL